MKTRNAQVVIVGAGGAGLSAAAASNQAGADVLVIDSNPAAGGQIWKQEGNRQKNPRAQELIDTCQGVSFLHSAEVFDADQNSVFLVQEGEAVRVEYEKLIIATGARELMLPFPGWTKPGVFSPGGLQSLVKGGFDVAGKRIVVAGTGPLLIAVAKFLRMKGADVVAVLEQASKTSLAKFGLSLLAHPRKLIAAKETGIGEALRTRTNAFVKRAFGVESLEGVRIWEKGIEKDIECDLLAVGYHLVPNLEIPSLLGCKMSEGAVITNEFGQTSVRDVFCAGEPLGIAGIDAACDTGTAAGLTATGQDASEILPRLRQHGRFRNLLRNTFRLRPELRHLPETDTIVCRCEDVSYDELEDCKSSREAKLHRRVGMGLCQGRVCGPALEYLKNWETGVVQPPLVPVESEALMYEE